MEVNPNDPYDVNVDLKGLNEELESINPNKVIKRKMQYRRFVQSTYYINSYENSMKFSNLLHEIPFYTIHNPRECLGIDEYVRYLYTMGNVDRFLSNQRNVNVLNIIVIKWKYITKLKAKKKTYNFTIKTPTTSKFRKPEYSNPLLNPVPSTPNIGYGVDNFIWSSRSTAMSDSNPLKRNLTAGKKGENGKSNVCKNMRNVYILLRKPGIEPGAQRWQRWILPLNHLR